MAPAPPGMLRLLLQPGLSESACAPAAPINRIRLTALAQPGGDVVHRQVFDVSPTASEWPLRIEVPVTSAAARIIVLMELITVAADGEAVQCSGMTSAITLEAGRDQQTASVVIYDGPVDNLRVTGVRITTAVPETVAEGETLQLQVQVDGPGTPRAAWRSLDPDVAEVSREGVVRVLRDGSARIVAQAGSFSDMVTITATQRAAALVITQSTLTAASLGEEAVFTATVLDPRGAAITGAGVQWTIDDAAVAENLGGGRFRAAANGRATVRATATANSAAAASAALVVQQQAAAVTVMPEVFVFTALGAETAFSAQARDARGNSIPDAAFEWSSSAPAVVAVSPAGAATALAVGAATVTARSGTVSGSTAVEVTQQPVRLVLDRDSLHFESLNTSVQVSARVLDGRNNEARTATVEWSSSAASVATVDASGNVRAVGNGRAVITARAGSVSSSLTVVVAQRGVRVTLSPSAAEARSFNQTVEFTAALLDAGGSRMDDAALVWTLSNPDVAENLGGGSFRTRGNGRTDVRVVTQDGTVSAAGHLTVQQEVARIEVAPASFVFTALGLSRTFTAEAFDGLENPMAAPIEWATNSSAITISGHGVVTAAEAGAATLTATALNGVSRSASVTVQPVSASLQASPAEIAFAAVGDTATITLTARDSEGHVVPLPRDITWSSSSSAATVSSAGLVTAAATGTAVITASSGELSATVDVVVGQQSGGGQITGRVLHATTQAGIAGATVSFNRNAAGQSLSVDRGLSTAQAPPVTTTDSDGRYTSPALEPGTYAVSVSAHGYVGTTLHGVVVTEGLVEAQSIPLVPASTRPGAITGSVSNAQTGYPIAGITVELRSGVGSTGGTPIATIVTSSSGSYGFYELAAGTYSIRAHGPGYVEGVRTGISVGGSTQANQNLALVAEAVTEGQVRIVLTWGRNPGDLDSHLTGPISGSGSRFHIAYYNRGSLHSSPFASLDTDVTSGHGPETITISEQFSGEYRYTVHHYSGSGTISTSGAVVNVFRGNTLVARFEPPSGARSGETWYVFRMNGNAITPVNTFSGGIQGMTAMPEGFVRYK